MAVPGRIGVLRRRLWNYPRAQRPRLFSVCRLCRVPAYLQIHAAGACKAGVQESLRHLHQERQTLAAYVFAHDAQPLGSASGLGLAEHRCIKLRLRRNDRECYMCSSVPRQYSWIVQLYSFTSETSNRYTLYSNVFSTTLGTSTTRTTRTGTTYKEGDDRTEAAFHGECVYSTLRIAKQHHNRAVRSTSHQVAH